MFLDRVTNELTQLLSDNLVGIYVWGSVATGSFVDGLSDIDQLIVVKRSIDDGQLAKLQDWAAQLMQEEKCAEKFDAVIVTTETINAGDGSGSQGGIEFWKGELQWTDNCLGDNPLVLDTVLKSGQCLYGPPATEVIQAVPTEKIVNALKQEIGSLEDGLENHFDDMGWRYYAITTLCRILYTFKEANYLSKKDALLWYRDTQPPRETLIEAALAYYDGDSTLVAALEAKEFQNFIDDVAQVLKRG